jgi:hypothetical protein
MSRKKMNNLMKRAIKALMKHGPMDSLGLYKQLRADGLRITLKELKQALRLMDRLGFAKQDPPVATLGLSAQALHDLEGDEEATREKIRRLLAEDGYQGEALDTALQLQLDMVELLRAKGSMPRDIIIDHLEAEGWRREYLEVEVCDPSTVPEDVRRLFPIYDRGKEPLVTIESLKVEIEELVSKGQDIPYFAFVSGPGMNLRVEFNNYDAERHKPVAAEGLMELIRRGADRIVTISEIWFKNVEGVATWEGVLILEATKDDETLHTATFEGKTSLGPWETSPAGPTGNLAQLFERAQAGTAK